MTQRIGLIALLSLILIIPANLCQAQQKNLKDYKKKYPDESKICLNSKRDIVINIVGDSLQISMRNQEESLCLDKNAILQANQSVTFSDNYKIKSLIAETRLPKFVGYNSIKVKHFDTSDYKDPMVFFDDIKSINFSFPKLEEGALTYLDYTYNISEPQNLGCFYFDSYLPIDCAKLTVSCPSELVIGYKLFNCDNLHVEFTKKNNGFRTEYCWTANNVPKLTVEDHSPTYPYFAAHMFVYIKEYTAQTKKIKILSDENDLHNWYHNLISSVNTTCGPGLKLLVDSLISNTPNELDKVKKLFFWVQDHIKYIAFEAGRGGYVPRNADEVYGKLYGDCKDMASLINKMLDLAGIESHLTWVGTRNIPYQYHELPLPLTDNHMITTYKYENQYFFLDATTGPHPFDYPPYFIQGKEAMIDLGPNKYEILKVPEVAPELNLNSDTLHIRLEGKKIIGKGMSYFRGYERFDMYNYMLYKDPSEQAKFLKNYFEKGNNKFLIDNYQLINFDQRDKDLIIKYQFNISDYSQEVGDEIYINMNLDKVNIGEPVESTRKTEIESNYKKKIINEVILEIPKGYKITFVPKNAEFKDDLFGFKVSYQTGQDEIRLTHEIYINYLLLKLSKMKDWNDMIETINNAYKSSIILQKESIN